jgi:hypothetical protein
MFFPVQMMILQALCLIESILKCKYLWPFISYAVWVFITLMQLLCAGAFDLSCSIHRDWPAGESM